jgi:carbamoyl-phosphate synthase small subunit
VGPQDGPLIAAIDTGIKASIIRTSCNAGRAWRSIPATSLQQLCSSGDPDAVFLANGPGDPSALDYIVGQRARA